MSLRIVLVALAFVGVAHARPAIVEDSAILARPDASWQYFGRFGVAIDGDYALVSGERYIEDPAAENGLRHEGAAFIYRRVEDKWSYVSRLGPVAVITTLEPGLAMKDGVVMTITDRWRIWERSGDTWTLQPVAGITPTALNGPDIEIDGGRILVARDGCSYSAVVMRNFGGTWRVEGELPGPDYTCRPGMPPFSLDLQRSRALMNDPGLDTTFTRRIREYRLGAGGWQLTGGADGGTAEIFGPPLALAGTNFAFASNRFFGTSVVYDSGQVGAYAHVAFQPVDQYMAPELESATVIERVGDLFAQRNYRFDRQGYAIHLFRVNEDAIHSQTHVAMLTPKHGWFLGNRLDASDNRVIVSGWGDEWGDNNVRVFELPASFETPPVQVIDFETPSDSAAWQPSAGSTFAITRAAFGNVYRQASTVGAPGSFLPKSNARDQAIQAEVTLRSFSGADRWIGLATRRSDDANYYYVTFRTSGALELKRMLNGTYTTIDSAPATLTTGRQYRLRLESIGTLHQVYLDDRLVLAARDRALTEGVAGILMHRAAADFDNVIVTPSPFTTILATDMSSEAGPWFWPAGSLLRPANGILNLPASAFSYTMIYGSPRIADTIMRVRIRPVSFMAPEDWIGVMARYRDDRNYLYVSLHGRNVIALWRRTNGANIQLATQRLTVTPGTWYDLRLEVINNRTRVYVNNRQILASDAEPGPSLPDADGVGVVGLVTKQASADYDDFLAYQP
jgi:hypothetical protein